MYKLVCKFVADLAAAVQDQKPLKLYARLLEHTGEQHPNAVARHVDAFSTFCSANAAAIEARDVAQMAVDRVTYSDKVNIDVTAALKCAPANVQEQAWTQLQAMAEAAATASTEDVWESEGDEPQRKVQTRKRRRRVRGKKPVGNAGPVDFVDVFKNMVESLQGAMEPIMSEITAGTGTGDAENMSENVQKVVGALFESGAMQKAAQDVKDAFAKNPPTLQDILTGIQQFCADKDNSDSVPLDAGVLQNQLLSMLPAMCPMAGVGAAPESGSSDLVSPVQIETMLAGLCGSLNAR